MSLREPAGDKDATPRSNKIRVFLVDDHDVVREGLMSILSREPDMEVVGEAPSAERALEIMQAVDPAVVILDHRLPGMDGVELCREIAERRLRAQVVILSAYLDEDVVHMALLAGARAYVVKDVEAVELKRAIRAAARHETVIDPKVAGRILSWATRLDPRSAGVLRPVELQILRHVAAGGSTAQIGRTMHISQHTVKSYLRDVYRKLAVKSQAEAVAVALRRGLL